MTSLYDVFWAFLHDNEGRLPAARFRQSDASELQCVKQIDVVTTRTGRLLMVLTTDPKVLRQSKRTSPPGPAK